MGYWNREINGFVPYQNKEKTLIEYTDEQIEEIMQQVAQGGMLTTGDDGHVKVVPRSKPLRRRYIFRRQTTRLSALRLVRTIR